MPMKKRARKGVARPPLRTAVFASTMDPIHLGHIEIIRYALEVCDKVVIGIAENPAKQPLFTLAERTRMAEEALAEFGSRVEIRAFTGLLVELVNQVKADVIVRGLRNGVDFAQERELALANRRLSKRRWGRKINTLFFMADDTYAGVSSSTAKDIARCGGTVADLEDFLPPEVAAGVVARLGPGAG